MTSANLPSSQSPKPRLVAVPPQVAPNPKPPAPSDRNAAVPPSAAPQGAAPNAQPQPEAAAPTRWWVRGAVVGGTLVALGAIAHIPMGPSLRADTYFKPLPDSHKMVYAEVPGTLTQLLVQPGQWVEQGTVVAILQPAELQEQILAKRTQLRQTQAGLDSAKQALAVAQAELQRHQAQLGLSQRRTAIAQGNSRAATSAAPPPAVAQVQNERASLAARVKQLEGSAKNLDEQLTMAAEDMNDLRTLADNGAVPQKHFRDAQKYYTDLKRQLGEKRGEIEVVRAQIQAKAAQTTAAQDQLTEDWRDRADETANLQAAWQTAQQQLVAANSAAAEQAQVVATVQAELTRLETQQQQERRLEAPIAGRVISNDLVQKEGRRMEANEAIVEIANTTQLNAVIEIPQANADVLDPGALVTIKPVAPGQPEHKTTLMKLEPVIQTDVTQQQRLILGHAVVNNSDGLLLPEGKAYAHIATEPIPLYEWVRLELMKLFKVRKYS